MAITIRIGWTGIQVKQLALGEWWRAQQLAGEFPRDYDLERSFLWVRSQDDSLISRIEHWIRTGEGKETIRILP